MPRQIEDTEKQSLLIEPSKESPQEKTQEENDVPVYMSRLKYDDETVERLRTEVFDEFESIKEERDKEKLEQKWDMLDNQFNGKLKENPDQQFNLHRQTTKIKITKIVNRAAKAFLKSDPIYSISPRPEYAREIGQDVCEKQEDFLDHKMDEVIPFKIPVRKAILSAAVKGTGILKVYHEIKREHRRREEVYQGVVVPALDQQGIPIIDPRTGKVAIDDSKNTGLVDFTTTYPEAQSKYPGYIKKLLEGKRVEIVVEYDETVYNDPMPKNVDLKNFYVRLNTEGYEGLKSTLLIVERVEYSWWELKKEERKGNFINVDELMYEKKDDKSNKNVIKNYRRKSYPILECVYYFKEKESDEEEKKIICWFDEDKKIFLGAMNYPYYGVDCCYIPFYMKSQVDGFYQPGIAEDLTDSNIAEDAILNFILEGAWISNTVTPITDEGSSVDTQFLEKRFVHGIPITTEGGKPVDFLNKYMRPFDTVGLLNMLNYLIKNDDDLTGVSSLMTGRADPIDPRAPASKTMALLEESGENIEDYILVMLGSFNAIADVLLQMYHQIAGEHGLRYRRRADAVVGGDPFGVINRYEMVAKTNIQSQAMGFNFERMNEKRENLALLQVVRTDPFFAQNPEAIYVVLKTLIKSWSPMWKNIINKVIPPMEQFKMKQLETAVQAVDAYVQAKVKNAQVTGVQLEFDPAELVQTVQQYVQEAITPPPPEEVKRREQESKM